MKRHLFTSESASMGHPDKIADQIADTVLDAVLIDDPTGRVACEVLLTNNLVVVAGEISTTAAPDFEQIVRDTIIGIGYDRPSHGYDGHTVEVRLALNQQSPDIAMGVDEGDDGSQGAGDQGMMFGFAANETADLMPLPIQLAHRLVATQAEARRSGAIPRLRPDAKSQVTVEYSPSGPKRIDTVVLSTQHGPEWNDYQPELAQAVVEHVIKPSLGEWWDEGITCLINPTGRFEIGGPVGDTGLTGRKIIVDSYGAYTRHGGGAFSGKDPSKVDRSASYMARYVAKNVVAAGLADQCELSLSYAIGVAEPTSVVIDTRATARVSDDALALLIRNHFDMTPKGIIQALDLLRPIYRPTAVHGHFGHVPGEAGPGTFSWERIDKADELREAAAALI